MIQLSFKILTFLGVISDCNYEQLIYKKMLIENRKSHVIKFSYLVINGGKNTEKYKIQHS
jgi:hypothetical protein